MCGPEGHHRGHEFGYDVIRGTARADVIDGLGGNDVINGFGGNDTICGNAGSDDLRGNGGADRLYGGPDGWGGFGDGILVGNKLRGGSGNDTLVPGVDMWVEEADETQSDTLLYDTSPRCVVVHLPAGTATGPMVPTPSWSTAPFG